MVRWRVLLLVLLVLVSCSEPAREPVVIIGHRGAPLIALENSIESFRKAREQGADGIELDVTLTADGVNVVLHDDTLDRTTTCQGLVASKTLADLGACSLQNKEPIRSLEQTLNEIGDEFSLIFVELKVFDDRVSTQVDDAVAQVLRSGKAAKVVLSSYSAEANELLAARQKEGVLSGWDSTSNEGLGLAQKTGAAWVLMPVYALQGREGDIARSASKQLVVYVVASANDFEASYDAGVRVMMTDSIPLLKALSE